MELNTQESAWTPIKQSPSNNADDLFKIVRKFSSSVSPKPVTTSSWKLRSPDYEYDSCNEIFGQMVSSMTLKSFNSDQPDSYKWQTYVFEALSFLSNTITNSMLTSIYLECATMATQQITELLNSQYLISKMIPQSLEQRQVRIMHQKLNQLLQNISSLYQQTKWLKFPKESRIFSILTSFELLLEKGLNELLQLSEFLP